MTHPALALDLFAELGSPVRGAGPCLGFVMRLDDVLTRWVRQIQAMQRHGQLLNDPPEVLARRALVEVLKPGTGRECPDCEVW